MDIGSNKPTREEQALVPHHLVDIRNPKDPMNAGDFVQAATPIIFDILSRNKVPIIVGGSTMWLQWLVHGTPDAPKSSEYAIQESERLIGHLHRNQDWMDAVHIAEQYDPKRISKLPKNDWYRLRRYLEIALTSKRQYDTRNKKEDSGDDNGSLTGMRIVPLKDVDVRGFFLSETRDALYRVIDSRCEEMLMNSSSFPKIPISLPGQGVLELESLFGETTRLLIDDMLDMNTTVAKAIGYRQAIQYLCRFDFQENDRDALVDFIDNFATVTRNYAQKQLKWYRKDDAFLWLQVNRSIPNASQRISEEIVYWLNQDKSQFDATIKLQMDVCKVIQSLRNDKRLLQEYNAIPKEELSEVHRQAVEYLQKYESFSKDDIGKERTTNDDGMKVKESDPISAYIAGVRSSETINSKALRTYVSNSPLLLKEPSNSSKSKKLIYVPTKKQMEARDTALQILCRKADECSLILRNYRPDLVEAVATMTDGDFGGSADESG